MQPAKSHEQRELEQSIQSMVEETTLDLLAVLKEKYQKNLLSIENFFSQLRIVFGNKAGFQEIEAYIKKLTATLYDVNQDDMFPARGCDIIYPMSEVLQLVFLAAKESGANNTNKLTELYSVLQKLATSNTSNHREIRNALVGVLEDPRVFKPNIEELIEEFFAKKLELLESSDRLKILGNWCKNGHKREIFYDFIGCYRSELAEHLMTHFAQVKEQNKVQRIVDSYLEDTYRVAIPKQYHLTELVLKLTSDDQYEDIRFKLVELVEKRSSYNSTFINDLNSLLIRYASLFNGFCNTETHRKVLTQFLALYEKLFGIDFSVHKIEVTSDLSKLDELVVVAEKEQHINLQDALNDLFLRANRFSELLLPTNIIRNALEEHKYFYNTIDNLVKTLKSWAYSEEKIAEIFTPNESGEVYITRQQINIIILTALCTPPSAWPKNLRGALSGVSVFVKKFSQSNDQGELDLAQNYYTPRIENLIQSLLYYQEQVEYLQLDIALKPQEIFIEKVFSENVPKTIEDIFSALLEIKNRESGENEFSKIAKFIYNQHPYFLKYLIKYLQKNHGYRNLSPEYALAIVKEPLVKLFAPYFSLMQDFSVEFPEATKEIMIKLGENLVSGVVEFDHIISILETLKIKLKGYKEIAEGHSEKHVQCWLDIMLSPHMKPITEEVITCDHDDVRLKLTESYNQVGTQHLLNILLSPPILSIILSDPRSRWFLEALPVENPSERLLQDRYDPGAHSAFRFHLRKFLSNLVWFKPDFATEKIVKTILNLNTVCAHLVIEALKKLYVEQRKVKTAVSCNLPSQRLFDDEEFLQLIFNFPSEAEFIADTLIVLNNECLLDVEMWDNFRSFIEFVGNKMRYSNVLQTIFSTLKSFSSQELFTESNFSAFFSIKDVLSYKFLAYICASQPSTDNLLNFFIALKKDGNAFIFMAKLVNTYAPCMEEGMPQAITTLPENWQEKIPLALRAALKYLEKIIPQNFANQLIQAGMKRQEKKAAKEEQEEQDWKKEQEEARQIGFFSKQPKKLCSSSSSFDTDPSDPRTRHSGKKVEPLPCHRNDTSTRTRTFI